VQLTFSFACPFPKDFSILSFRASDAIEPEGWIVAPLSGVCFRLAGAQSITFPDGQLVLPLSFPRRLLGFVKVLIPNATGALTGAPRRSSFAIFTLMRGLDDAIFCLIGVPPEFVHRDVLLPWFPVFPHSLLRGFRRKRS